MIEHLFHSQVWPGKCDQVAFKVPTENNDILLLNNGDEKEFKYITHKHLHEYTNIRIYNIQTTWISPLLNQILLSPLR